MAKAQLSAEDEVHWLSRMGAESENMRAALTWMDNSGDPIGPLRLLANIAFLYWSSGPYDSDIDDFLERNLSRARDIPPEVEVWVRFAALWSAANTGNLDRMHAHAQAGLVAASHLGSDLEVGFAHMAQGVAWEVAGNCEQSAASHRRSLFAFLQTPELRLQQAMARAELGDKLLLCGDIHEGTQLIDEAIAIHQQMASASNLSLAYGQRGHAARIQGDGDLAKRMFANAVVQSELAGDRSCSLGALIGLAGVELNEGRPEDAARLVGVVDAAREAQGLGRYRHPLHSRQIIDSIKEKLGDEDFQTFSGEGRVIPFEMIMKKVLTHADIA